jgi:hypothetical protein
MHFNFKLILSLGVLIFLLTATKMSAQSKDADTVKRFSAFPFPVVYYAPETRFVFGVGGVATFRPKKNTETARPSSVTGGAAYTQNKQVLLYTTYQLFLDNNKNYIFGEAGYYIYSYFFYGTGQNEVAEELYRVNYPRIKLNATRLIRPHLYAGIGYQFENYNVVETEVNGSLAADTIPGSQGSRTSGLGLQLIYDTRDTVFYPSSGWYGALSTMNNGKHWGGNFNFNRIELNLSKYQRLYKNAILALNSYNSFVLGTAPFQQQSQLGGNKQMRGYYQGRFTDYNQMALGVETRFPVYRRFGGVAFFNAGALGNQQDFIRFNDMKYSYGLGLRFNVNRKDHLNMRLDYAIGPGTSGFYFTIGEAF